MNKALYFEIPNAILFIFAFRKPKTNMAMITNSTIEKVYRKYRMDLWRYFMSYVHDEMMAEDMVHDLFVKLMGYDDMIIETTAKSFLFTIANRMMVDEMRHQQFVRRATVGYQLQREQDCFWQDSETLECRQLAEMEQAKLRTLPQRMAEVYRLTRFEGRSAQELADELNISKRTVEYHLLMARREIRQTLRKAINM